MRLLCPKCYEEYEVTDDVIPGEGRDVQCSVCDETWFVEGEPAPLARRAIDPGVFSILQQEVQREMAARQADSQTAIKPAPAPAPIWSALSALQPTYLCIKCCRGTL